MKEFSGRIKKNNLIGQTTKNTILSLSSKGYAMILYMLLDILLARMLSLSEYGQWSYFYSIVSMCFWVAWFGLNASAKVFVAKTAKEYSRQAGYIKTALLLRFLLSIVISIFICIMLQKNVYLLGDVDKYPQLKSMLLIGGVLIFFNSFSEFFKELYIGLVKFKNIFWLTILEYTGYLVFGVGFILMARKAGGASSDVVALEFGYITSLFLVTVVGIYEIFYYLKKNGCGKETRVQLEYAKNLLRYSMPILVTSFGALILFELDTFMIGRFYTGEEVAVYSVAKKLCSKLSHINLALCTATMTGFVIINKENLEEKKEHFRKVIRLNNILTGTVVILSGTVAAALIPYIYGFNYEPSKIVFRMLLPYYAMSSISNFYGAFLDYQGMAKQRSYAYLMMLTLAVLFNIVLIPSFGVNGAALGTSLCVIPYFILTYILTKRRFERIRADEIEEENA